MVYAVFRRFVAVSEGNAAQHEAVGGVRLYEVTTALTIGAPAAAYPTVGVDRAVTARRVVTMRRPFGRPPESQDTFGVQHFGFTHDDNGNPTGITSPESGGYSEAIGYTPVDQVESFNLPAGPFSVAYDADRTPTGGSSPYSGGTLGFDGEGRLTQLGPISYGYDGDDYLTSITSPDGTITYGYAGSAAPKTITTNGPVQGVVTLGRNDQFQATSVGVQGGPTAAIGVDADGVVSSAGALTIERNTATFIKATTVDATTDTYTRNQFGEPTAYRANYNGSEIFSEEYVRDRGGRIRTKTVRIRNPATGDLETYTAAYGYDTPGRLQTVTYNGTDAVHYAYDANNNLIGAPPVTPTPAPGPVRLYLQEATPAATPAVTAGTWTDTQASERAAMGQTPEGALATTTVTATDCEAAGNPRRLLANVFVSPLLAEAHEFTGEELFTLAIGAAEGDADDALQAVATVWVMDGATGAKRCEIAVDAVLTPDDPLPTGAPQGIEASVTVASGPAGCLGQTAETNDRIVVEVGFACTESSAAPVAASTTRGGTDSPLGHGADPNEGGCKHPGYLQVDGGLVFTGAAGPSPCGAAATTIAVNSRRLLSVTVNAQNQATDASLIDPQSVTGHYAYTYDDRGALETKTELDAPNGTPIANPTIYDYDDFGNLRHVGLPDGTTIDYLIDAANRRVGRVVTTPQGTQVQKWLYQSALRPVAELDASDNVVAFFVYGDKPNVPEYLEKGGQRYRLITDHLGSVRLVVNAVSGQIQQRLDYDEHGNVLQDTNPGFQPFGYAGGLYDPAVALVRFAKRDYDPSLQRWSARDPIGFSSGDVNTYAYVRGDPINSVDPSGLDEFPLDLGMGWRGRVDSFPSGEGFEIHVATPTGKEVGVVSGKQGWIAKHGHPASPPSGIPGEVMNKINGVNVEQLRARGALPKKGMGPSIKGGRYINPGRTLYGVAGGLSILSGLLGDYEVYSRATKNGVTMEQQFRRDLHDAGDPALLMTPFGILPNPYAPNPLIFNDGA